MKYNAVLPNEPEAHFDIRNDAGMGIGIAFINEYPFDGCEPVTLKDAENNARLWAASTDMYEAISLLLTAMNTSGLPWNTDSNIESAYQKAKEAWIKAKPI